MIETIAISSDRPMSPIFEFKNQENNFKNFAWGIGLYPDGSHGSYLIKDTVSNEANALANIMTKTSSFFSKQFFATFYDADQEVLMDEIQPIQTSYAGSDWMFMFNGNLAPDFTKKLPLESNLFEPVGTSASEYILCYLLNKMYNTGYRSLFNSIYNTIYQWLININDLGNSNLFLSSDEGMIVYQDKNNFEPIYFRRMFPPYNYLLNNYSMMSVATGINEDKLKSYIVFSQQPQNIDDGWTKMLPGQMMVVSNGIVIWDSNFVSPYETTANTDTRDQTIKQNISTNESSNGSNRRILSIFHETKYKYENAIRLSKHVFKLKPAIDEEQRLLKYDLNISCNNRYQNYDDVFGNKTRYIEISEPYSELTVTMKAKVSISPNTHIPRSLIENQNQFPIPWMPWQRQMLSPYLLPNELPETQLSELMDYAKCFIDRNNNDVLRALDDINKTIYTDYAYVSGSTTLATTAYEVYVTRKGVCQDFANLFICLCRLLSIPARYRAGYIFTGAKYDNPEQGDATHAWVEVYLPWCGWKGYDPTNGCQANSDHIRVASGREYHDATPTSGTIYQGGGGKETLSINVKVIEENE
ncbi:class II glutamine amidotransferase [Francisellaceae bacterium]|nr:class II glutamine amidotransferase [Francisellaceae bacterium]